MSRGNGPKALVTGATGFIGAHVVRELLRQGFKVRALVREGSDRRSLEGLDVELALGDLRDQATLEKALEGCEVLFHTAALYSFWVPRPEVMYEVNVKGTANLLEAASRKRIQKVVYTSTESTIGIDRKTGLGRESIIARPEELTNHYKRSKFLAEKVALEMAQKGLPVVVVNPTATIGPCDRKPTPTGRLILSFLNRRIPAYVDTGLNLVNVEDVARGHFLALEKGKVGERYILGNENLTFQAVLEMLGRLTGIRPPRIRIPFLFALAMGYLSEVFVGRLLGRAPWITVEAVQAAREFRFFDCSKAVEELGFTPTPVEMGLEKAVRWFQENGYVKA
ncbi:MAG: NAD-dependent epimerase/dehydratase family protein [Anaerolineae bacterium]|nr:NAD-dependent epimerase/dehydratase family protein [Anaerolineae bacterium]MDW8099424.1 NAD-dependent epimerase/dehydratase family protein [Anaerolineae bacterium]